MDQKLASVLVPEKMSWATATQPIRKCRTRIEKIGGSRVDIEPIAWGLDAQVWSLVLTGEEAMKKGIPILKKAGFESVEDLPRTVVGFVSEAYQDLLPQLRLSTMLNDEQRVQVRVPNARGLHRTTQCLLQKYLNLVDWKSPELPSTERRCKISSIKSVNELQCYSVNVCANCASMIFLTTSSCRMHWSTCCSKACVSSPDGRGLSWPPSAVGKVYREFVVDHGTCH